MSKDKTALDYITVIVTTLGVMSGVYASKMSVEVLNNAQVRPPRTNIQDQNR